LKNRKKYKSKKSKISEETCTWLIPAHRLMPGQLRPKPYLKKKRPKPYLQKKAQTTGPTNEFPTNTRVARAYVEILVVLAQTTPSPHAGSRGSLPILSDRPSGRSQSQAITHLNLRSDGPDLSSPVGSPTSRPPHVAAGGRHLRRRAAVVAARALHHPGLIR
jgi:hypothetical protein